MTANNTDPFAKVWTSFIGIMPDTSVFPEIQAIREKYITPLKCGPHVTMMDPFISNIHFADAKQRIREALIDFEPFTIRLEAWDSFRHNNSCTLWLKPVSNPPNALADLSARLLKVYPNLDDVIKHQKGFTPHMSMGSFKDIQYLQKVQQQLEQTWKPIEFIVKEIYFFTYVGFGPYQVREVVPLGPVITPPYHLPVPLDPQQDKVVMVNNMPKGAYIDDNRLMQVFKDFNPVRVEIRRDRGKTKGFGMVEFPNHEMQLQVLTKTKPFMLDGMTLKLKPSIKI
jgi:2'-5' RNA ligase